MRLAVALLLAAVCLANAPAYAQERGWRGAQGQRQSLVPSERPERGAQRRERTERREPRRERRFTPEERRQLRQDLLDANRDIRGRRR
jgi:hypothetical protein